MIIIFAERVLEYIKSEADKEVERKDKVRERDIKGYIIGSVYKAQKRRRNYRDGRNG